MAEPAATAAAPARERRRHHRTRVARDVRLQIAGEDEIRGLTADVSAGGLFVACRSPAPVGTRVKFVLDLEVRAIRGHAEVAWIRVRSRSAEEPRGMGLRIVFVLDDGARHLAEFVAAPSDGPILGH